jgi:hypothetical protein
VLKSCNQLAPFRQILHKGRCHCNGHWKNFTVCNANIN